MSCIKLPEDLVHPRKGLINIQNIDDYEYFNWRLFRYVNLADHNPGRITKADKDFTKRVDFKDIKFPVKISYIHKIEKNNCISIRVLVIKIRKNIQSMYQNNVVLKNMLTYY